MAQQPPTPQQSPTPGTPAAPKPPSVGNSKMQAPAVQKSQVKVARAESMQNGPVVEDTGNDAPKFGLFRKLQHKFRKVSGAVDAGDLPQKQEEAAQGVDAYREDLVRFNESLLAVLQRNPEFRKSAYSDQNVEYPPHLDPFTPIPKALSEVKKPWKNNDLLKAVHKACSESTKLLHDHQRKGRSKLHTTRTFLNTDRFELDELKVDVKKDKEALEIALAELANKPDNQGRQNAVDKMTKRQEASIARMDAWIRKMTDRQEQQRQEVLSFLREQERFHREMARICGTIKTHHVIRPAATTE